MTREERERLHLLLLNNRVKEMQDSIFFVQDDEGALRRWYPPRPVQITSNTEGEG